ncbi:MAG TPA: dTDP-4-dehydrorhamnose 3,5-epimerase [Alphaproteobacteria bacterium]|nr:dTDP-4-dehydrorhamnose 3,5-epimerase [Rhodospirillaceae bacterium]HRJ12089.1 dTDP-4-dehydrorhamnose 3,5-epimerase [Alphaproteobacteria bacterium]
MNLKSTPLAGLQIIESAQLRDARGYFTKCFHRDSFQAAGIAEDIAEIYYSMSHKGAVRALHFQTPPHAHSKIIFCLQGKIFDAAVDLRRSSPTYGQHFTMEISGDNPRGLYIPAGFAHGFIAMTDDVLFMNATSHVWNGESDGGIHWQSCGIQWPDIAPIVSDKDKNLPAFADYESPFA